MKGAEGIVVDISIIIPVYNTEKYLKECLDSVLGQTKREIEIICVNDGSTDGSENTLLAYAQKDIRICVISKKNGGLSSARNTGVAAAVGKYIMYLDSDDTLPADACQILWRHVNASDPDIIIYGMIDNSEDSCAYKADDKWFEKVATTRFAWYSPFSPHALFYENGGYPYACRNLYRKKFLYDNGILFQEEIKYGEDLYYQFTSFPCAKRILFIPDRLYIYRRLRAGSLTQLHHDYDKRCVEHAKIISYIHSEWLKRGFDKEYGLHLYCWMLNFLVPDLQKLESDMRNAIAKEVIPRFRGAAEYYDQMNSYDRGLFDRIKAWSKA